MPSASANGFIKNDLARRASVFAALRRRNHIVGFLRFVVPGIGVVLAGFLIFQIVLTNIAKDYGISGLHVDKDQFIIDQPRYGGVMANGMHYEVVAEVARVQINTTDIINLENARITIEQDDGYKMVANTPAARLDLTRQQVQIKGVMHTIDSDNVVGELNDSIIDWPSQTLTANAQVKFQFEDGSTINAQSLVYDANAASWEFSEVIYTTPGQGGN